MRERGGREGGREGEREGGRKGRREGGKEGRREGGRGERELLLLYMCLFVTKCVKIHSLKIDRI